MSLILWRYIGVQTLKNTGLLLLLFIAMYVTIDMVEMATVVSFSVLWKVYALKLPQVLSHLLPLVCAMAIVLVATWLKRTGEWTAYESAGGHPFWLFGALLGLPLLLFPLFLPLNHLWVPKSVSQFELALGGHIDGALNIQRQDNTVIMRNFKERPNWMLQLQVDEKGRAKQMRVEDIYTHRVIEQWNAKDGFGGTTIAMPIASLLKIPVVSSNGILAAAFTTVQLEELIPLLQLGGTPTRALEAAIALRTGQSLAQALVPLVSLLLFLSIGKHTAFYAVLVAIGVSALYWICLIFTWTWIIHGNGAMWAICYAPAVVCLGIGLGGGEMIRFRRR